jgi:hypothetical protein
MTRKYEREYRKFVIKLSTWLKETKERIEILSEIEALNQLSYDQWYKIFKEEALIKKIPSPPSPPSPRLIKEGDRSEPSIISKPEEHSCDLCSRFHKSFLLHDNYCDKNHSGYRVNITNNCEDYDPKK